MSLLRIVKLHNYKGHKVIAQSTQSVKYQQISTCALCAFLVHFEVKNIFRSELNR